MAKKKAPRSSAKETQKWHAVPLKGSFMVMSMIGFLITAYLIHDVTYKTTFMIVFIAMFIASMISMTQAPTTN